MSDCFSIKIAYAVLSTDIPNNKKYILSTTEDNISLPLLDYTEDFVNINLESKVIEYLKNFIIVSELEMIPQLISFNDILFPNKEEKTTYILYGFIVSHVPSLNNCYWKEFDYLKPNEYNNIIFKVIQNLS